jgi:hypothetical protein
MKTEGRGLRATVEEQEKISSSYTREAEKPPK